MDYFGKDSLAVLDVGELEQIVGGDSYNPGTLNWVNGMGKVPPYQRGPRTPFDDKFEKCLNTSWTRNRGPYNCFQ